MQIEMDSRLVAGTIGLIDTVIGTYTCNTARVEQAHKDDIYKAADWTVRNTILGPSQEGYLPGSVRSRESFVRACRSVYSTTHSGDRWEQASWAGNHRAREHTEMLVVASDLARRLEDIREHEGDLHFPEILDFNLVRHLANPQNSPIQLSGNIQELIDYVQDEIKNVWQSRQPNSLGEPDLGYALPWTNAAACTLQAIYENVSSLDQACEPNTFRDICVRTHKLFIEHNLWGKDTGNRDRAYWSGGKLRPLTFENLEEYMRRYYVLLVLATLNGISTKAYDNLDPQVLV